jgi:hypothetical protein
MSPSLTEMRLGVDIGQCETGINARKVQGAALVDDLWIGRPYAIGLAAKQLNPLLRRVHEHDLADSRDRRVGPDVVACIF